MTPEHAEILASIQRRAPAEGREHLVATVEWLFNVPPALADRLIPRTSSPAADAARADCEKPIRDENGKFLGCEAGGGSGGGAGGGESSSGGGSSGGGAESDPFASRPPPRAPKAAASPAPAGDDKAARLKAERARAEAEHRAYSDFPYEPTEAHLVRMKAIEEDRDPDQAEKDHVTQRHAASIEKGHVKPDALPVKARSAFEAKAKEVRQYASEVHDEITAAQAAAAQHLNDLRALNSSDGDPVDGAFDVENDHSEYASAATYLGRFAGKEGDADYDNLMSEEASEAEDLTEPEEMDEPEEPDDEPYEAPDAPENDTPEAIEAYEQEKRWEAADKEARANYPAEKKAYEEHLKAKEEHAAKVEQRKAVVKAKAAKAADALDALHDKQLDSIEKLKAVSKDFRKASRSVRSESEGVDPDDMVDAKLRRAAEKAEETLDKEGLDQSVYDEANKIIEDFDVARAAAADLHSKDEEEREDLLAGSDEDAAGEALSALKEAAKITKNRAAKLRKALGQAPKATKAKTTKKPAAKKPAKAKAAAEEEDDEDIEEDEPEEDDEE